MRRVVLLLVGLLVLAGVAVAASGGTTQPRWVITDLGTLGGPRSYTAAINERGQIVGYSSVVTAAGKLRRHAVLWEDGRVRDLGSLPGKRYSLATDINERGQIVGAAWDRRDTRDARVFLWEKGKLRDLGPLIAYNRQTIAINDRGQVIWTRCEDHYCYSGNAVLWESGRVRTLRGRWSWANALNVRGQVVGVSASALESGGYPDWHAVLWDTGKSRTLRIPGDQSAAVAINERGQVAACGGLWAERDSCWIVSGRPDPSLGFLWESGTAKRLGTLGGRRSGVTSINGRGQIVGWTDTKANTRSGYPIEHASLWANSKLTDLGVLPGDTASDAVAVNDVGQAIGISQPKAEHGTFPPGSHRAFVWESGRMVELPDLGGKFRYSRPVALNDHGQIIGYAATAPGGKPGEKGIATHAVLWTLKR